MKWTVLEWMWVGMAAVYVFALDNSAAGVGCIVMSELMNQRKMRGE